MSNRKRKTALVQNAAKSTALAPTKPESEHFGVQDLQHTDGLISFLASMIMDSRRGHVKPPVAAVCFNGVGKMVKVFELAQKYGIPNTNGSSKELQLYSDAV